MRKTTTLLLCLALGVLFFNGCNAVENGTTSGTRLYVQSITGTGLDGKPGSNVIYSDVMQNGGGVINDVVLVSVDAVLMDPNQVTPTNYQNVIIDQIDIHYTRADGLNVEGKDVPRSYSLTTSQMVMVADPTTSFNVEIMRHNAKLEAPLVQFADAGSGTLKLEAHLTIHSKDTAGKRLAPVKASVSIECANFADADDSGGSGS